MKIAFLIGSFSKSNPGTGGHYYSLIETVNKLAIEHDVFIINIGIKKAQALNNLSHRVIYVQKEGIKIYSIYREVKSIIKNEKPDLIHSFDSIVFFWARTIGNNLKIMTSLTKCGGVNPIYSPFAQNLVLFSEENRAYLSSKRKFQNSNIHVIPNRVQSFESDYNRISEMGSKLGSYKSTFIFLRITRIKKFYQKSSQQLINLVNKLNDDGFTCSLIFIGVIEDESCYNVLKKLSGENVFFFTEKKWTKNSKQLIEIADAVLGTGRSFMEAASKEKMLLCPIKNGDLPLLVNQTNFNDAFKYNFSERVLIKNHDENLNYLRIRQALINKESLVSHASFARGIYCDYFDSQNLLIKYNDFFNKSLANSKRMCLDYFLHFLYVLRTYFGNF